MAQDLGTRLVLTSYRFSEVPSELAIGLLTAFRVLGKKFCILSLLLERIVVMLTN